MMFRVHGVQLSTKVCAVGHKSALLERMFVILKREVKELIEKRRNKKAIRSGQGAAGACECGHARDNVVNHYHT